MSPTLAAHVLSISILLLTTAIACVAIAARAIQRWDHVDARILATFLAGAAIASSSYALDLLSTPLAFKAVYHGLYYLGSQMVALSALLYALWYTGRDTWLKWPTIAWIIVPTCLVLVFRFTDSWHHLHYDRVWLDTSGLVPLRGSKPGPLYWVNLLVAMSYLALSLYLLGNRFIRSRGVYRGQLASILLAIATPVLANTAYLAGLRPWGWLNLTPCGYAIAGLAFAWGIRSVQLLDLRPVAREIVIQRIPVGIIVLDSQARVVEINTVATRFLSLDANHALGREFRDLCPAIPALLHLVYDEAGTLPVEFTVGAGIETRHFSAETALLNNNNHTGGRLLILRDITQDKQAERQRLALQRAIATQEEKERLARQLHDGVGQVIGYLHRQAQKAQDYWTQGQPALANAAVTHLAEVAADAHADLRDFVLGIPAEPDSRQGLLSPLRRYAGQLASTDGLSIRLQVEDSFADDKLDPQVQTELLSIIKEALSNVRNHAATKQAEVVLSASSESVKVVIQDQGCGFDLARVQSGPARLGLDILRARAIRAGGLLQILTAPGKGTQVVVELPVVRVDSPITLPDLRVLLADDQPLYRQGLRALLAARSIQVVAEADSGEGALQAVRGYQPNLVLLGLNMPGLDNFETLRRIKAEQPDLLVVVLTADERWEVMQQALHLGANGYLLTSIDADDLFQALERVVQGDTPVAPSLIPILLDRLSGSSPAPAGGALQDDPLAALTPRQREILSMIGRGMPYKTIARDLCLSQATIKYHVANILERLEVKTRAQAVSLMHTYEQSADSTPHVG